MSWPAPDGGLTIGPPSPGYDDVLDEPRTPNELPSLGDRIYRGVATACAMVSLVIVGLTFIFLLWESRQIFGQVNPFKFLTGMKWNGGSKEVGIGGLLIATMLVAVIGLVIAVPLALAMALFINEFAPARLRTFLTSVMDLLAAVPSLIYGFWGFFALMPQLRPIARWITEHLSAIPLFRLSEPNANLTQSAFVAGVVVGIMIVPIITSVSRDVMSQVPRELCEGALALGGTRWGMIKDVILPFGRSGIVGATLLGLGRALGETIAVALVISLVFTGVNWNVLQQGAGSIAALIVTRFGEATPLERSALIAAGLGLFMLTFAINLISRTIVARSAKDWSMR